MDQDIANAGSQFASDLNALNLLLQQRAQLQSQMATLNTQIAQLQTQLVADKAALVAALKTPV